MSFVPDYRTLRNGKIFGQNYYLSVNAENSADAQVARDSERIDESITGVSSDLIESYGFGSYSCAWKLHLYHLCQVIPVPILSFPNLEQTNDFTSCFWTYLLSWET